MRRRGDCGYDNRGDESFVPMRLCTEARSHFSGASNEPAEKFCVAVVLRCLLGQGDPQRSQIARVRLSECSAHRALAEFFVGAVRAMERHTDGVART